MPAPGPLLHSCIACCVCDQLARVSNCLPVGKKAAQLGMLGCDGMCLHANAPGAATRKVASPGSSPPLLHRTLRLRTACPCFLPSALCCDANTTQLVGSHVFPSALASKARGATTLQWRRPWAFCFQPYSRECWGVFRTSLADKSLHASFVGD